MALLRRATATVVGLLLSAVALVVVSSAAGGPVTWAVTRGGSMLPEYTPGTLVVLARQSVYEVGDVVAYRNGDLRAVVMHRVVEVQDARLTLRGDANTWTDPYRPTTDEAVGTPVLTVPGAGEAVALLRGPLGTAGVLGVLGLLLSLATRGSTRRTAGPARAGAQPRPALAPLPAARPRGPSDRAETRSWAGTPHARRQHADAPPLHLPAGTGGAAGTALLAVAALLALTVVMPRSAVAVPLHADAAASVDFSYAAQPPAGVVYPSGRVVTGDPVFLRVVDRVTVRAALALRRAAAVEVDGSWHLEVEVSDDSGWHAPVYRSAPRPLLADRELEVVLTPSVLLRAAERAASATGAQAGTRQVTVSAVLDGRVAGGGGGAALETRVPYRFSLDAVTLRPLPEQAEAAPVEVSTGTGRTAATQERLLGLPVGALQRGLLAAGVLALVLLVLARRAEDRPDEASRLRARHRDLLLAVDPVRLDGPVVDVAGLDELFALATRYERLVLHWSDAGGVTYLVRDDGTAYRRRVGPARTAAAPLVPSPRSPADAGAHDAAPLAER